MQLRGNLFVGLTSANQIEHLAFTKRHVGQSAASLFANLFQLAARTIQVQRFLNVRLQLLQRERLFEHGECSQSHRFDGQRDVGMSADDDHGQLARPLAECGLQLEAVHPWQFDVHDQTTDGVGEVELQKALRRRK